MSAVPAASGGAMRFGFVAVHVGRELLALRHVLGFAAFLAAGCGLAWFGAGSIADPLALESAGAFGAAARVLALAPALAGCYGLLLLPQLWPGRLRDDDAGRVLHGLPLPLPVLAWAPWVGVAAGIWLVLAVGGGITGAFLSTALEPAPACRQVWQQQPTVLRGQLGRWRGHRLPLLVEHDDGAVFELRPGLRADQLQIELGGAFTTKSAAGTASVQLRWREDGVDRVRNLAIGPGAQHVVVPLPDADLMPVVTVLRTSQAGPPVAIGHQGLRLRDRQPRSLVCNGALAFLSLWPPWLAASALLWMLMPLLARGTASLLGLAAFGITLLLPGLNAGVRIGDFAEGRWIGWLGWADAHAVSFCLATAGLGFALLTAWLQSPRQRVGE